MIGAGTPSVSITQPTTAATRFAGVSAAVDTLANPNRQRNLADALPHVGIALEGIHQLDDARRKRNEWSWDIWTRDEIELWRAHLGARNGAHHTDWTPIYSYSDGLGSGERWSPAPSKINSPVERSAYVARLENKPAVASLQAICALLARVID